jgi:hypothetical protein
VAGGLDVVLRFGDLALLVDDERRPDDTCIPFRKVYLRRPGDQLLEADIVQVRRLDFW